jgi:hypothetical protein
MRPVTLKPACASLLQPLPQSLLQLLPPVAPNGLQRWRDEHCTHTLH